jgi:hypothetical protein
MADGSPRVFVSSTIVVLLGLAACGGAPVPVESPQPPPAPREQEDWQAEQQDREIVERLSASYCGGDSPKGISDEPVEALAQELPNAKSATQLAVAKRALLCSSAGAGLMVFRLVPALLLRRVDGKRLNDVYAFLKHDRPHALALFKTMLSDGFEALDAGLAEQPAELRRDFRPERVLGATCDELRGLTPKFEGQFRAAYEVLERNGCDEERTQLVRRCLQGTSQARAAACRAVDSKKGYALADAVDEAARTDPGYVKYEKASSAIYTGEAGIVGAIVSAIVSPLTGARASRKPVMTMHLGKLLCEPVAARLRARRP